MADYNNTDVIDGTVEDVEADDAQPEEQQAEPPTLRFGAKAILTADEESELVRERIKEHEAAITKDELALFEAEAFGNEEQINALNARIHNSYALVQRYVAAYNARYGGNEND